MKLNMGKTIKRLRNEKKMSQEEFAEILGVSSQSVSRWENELCYPDIELIPLIASFFDISADKLMGIDDLTDNKTAECFLNEFQAQVSIGNIEECIRTAREGVERLPNNYVILNKLMYALFLSGSDDANIENWKENRKKYDSEIVAIGERIIKYCPDAEIRLEATARLAFHHCEMHRKDLGRSIYETLPSMENTKEIAIWWALNEKEKLPYTRELIRKSYSFLTNGLYRLAQLLSDEEAIKVYKAYFELKRLMHDGNIFICDWEDAKLNYLIAKHYLNLNNTEKAIEHLNSAAEAAKAFDNRPKEQPCTSLLLGEQIFLRNDFDTADSRSLYDILCNDWLMDKEFDIVRCTKVFNEIIEALN